MAARGLSNPVQGAGHTAQEVTWTDCEGDPQDLTGATITARILNLSTGVAAASTGVFVATAPASGIFTWTYSAADLQTAGKYIVQFIATYADTKADKTYEAEWEVKRAI